MSDLFAIMANSFIVGMSGAMMPGPLFTMDIARTPAHGPWTGTLLAAGHSILELFMVVALSYGLALFVKDSPTVSRVIAAVGGVGLSWMACGMFKKTFTSAPPGGLSVAGAPNQGETISKVGLVTIGALTTISSPYWFMWWIMVGSPLLLNSMQVGPAGPPLFYVGHILSDLGWYTLVAFLVWRGRRAIVGAGYKLLIGACALFLVWLGGNFIHAGLTGGIVTAFS